MTSPKFLFYLTRLFFRKVAQTTDPKFSSSLHQVNAFVATKTGHNFTLQCFYEGNAAERFYWYKQTLGQEPRLISTFYKYKTNEIFHDEFKNNPRFKLDTKTGKNHLKITDLQISDSATYYCARSSSYKLEFCKGATVNVKGSGLKIPATVHQSASESIQPGGSVTLNCTLHTGTCNGEHSVYWFKNLEESQPGLIYTHGGRNDQCERKPDTHTPFNFVQVPEGITKLVKGYFQDLQFCVTTQASTTAWQHLEIGIMAGCTISPLVFTMAMELIIQASRWVVGGERLKSGLRLPPIRVYMDDMTTITTTNACTKRLLYKLQGNIRWARMEIKPSKSCSISIVKGQSANERFHINDKPIPTTLEKPIKSLDRLYNPDLKDSEQVEQLKQDTISGLKQINSTVLPRKLKL
ncbi:uncharacterized protein LOC120573558 [Perca fluviatilis]|uniref:uncharacterized protein LOC120573558 n=1 Tax=Perca fluviatilis TaxID=8168 RepID=UPI0019631112|nr:uncharacterized protein LOC120573558 [Perca fluviatilis]